jgi:transcriptional regulator with XRE-family HTH domain
VDFSQEERSKAIAAEVRAWMARRQRSGRSLALELGCSEIYLSRRLTGKVPFDVAELATIADLLEVPVSVFFEIPVGLKTGPTSAPHDLEEAA